TTTATMSALGTLSGFIGSETVTAAVNTATFADQNVGTGKTITVSYTLAGGTNSGVASNYSLANNTTTGNITAKALTIGTATANNKTYDGTTTATMSALGTLSGFIGSETVTAAVN
ncbi:YDG domain-containing protein, partial [Polynucleobacter sp. Fuers-14]|uniref:YDG domain-containing protein n=1 Tax=Polynucleobacter sp. Fuers-14 TaxID=1758364 RepID=UPI001C0E0A8C